jgi:3-hydroxy-3-methylglutaryl CoA synthase
VLLLLLLLVPVCTQEALAFSSDREDTVSLARTAVTRLLEGYGVDPAAISR